MKPDIMASAVKYFREHEGVVDHMYLDVVGLVTVGVGFMLPTRAAAAKLPFVRRTDGFPASEVEKRYAWGEVKRQLPAKVASYYRKYTALMLTDEAIDAKLQSNLQSFYTSLKLRFRDLDHFPPPAQLGLLDMAYSLGYQGFTTKYPKMCAAAEVGNWKICAEESARKNVSPSRNRDMANLFLSITEEA